MQEPSAMPMALQTLERTMVRFERKDRAQRILTAASWFTLAWLPLLALRPLWGLGLGALGLISAFVFAYYPIEPGRSARKWDRLLGLNGVCDTAVHLHAQGHPAAEPVLLDAVDALQLHPLPALRRPRLLPTALGLALSAFLSAWEPAAPPPLTPTTPDLAQALDELEGEARQQGRPKVVAAIAALRAAQSQAAPTLRPSKGQTSPRGPGQDPKDNSAARLDDIERLAREASASVDPTQRAQGERVLGELTDLREMDAMLRQLAPSAQGLPSPPSALATADAGQAAGKAGASTAGTGTSPTLSAALESGDAPAPEREPNIHPWDSAREQLLQAWADELAQDVMNAIKDRTERGASTAPEGSMDMGSELGKAGTKAPSPTTSLPNRMSTRPPGAQTAAEALQARINSPSQTAAPSGAAGEGGQEDGASPQPAGAQAASPTGPPDSVEGRLDPANLDGEARDQALDLIARRAVSGGPTGVDPALDSWYAEAERALAEEPMPPLMENLVRAYLVGIQEPE